VTVKPSFVSKAASMLPASKRGTVKDGQNKLEDEAHEFYRPSQLQSEKQSKLERGIQQRAIAVRTNRLAKLKE
jgi:hypothetical protein